jgi:hypothetical protein
VYSNACKQYPEFQHKVIITQTRKKSTEDACESARKHAGFQNVQSAMDVKLVAGRGDEQAPNRFLIQEIKGCSEKEKHDVKWSMNGTNRHYTASTKGTI